MSEISRNVEKTLSVQILERNGEVTIAANNGIVVTVRSNDVNVALGAVFAANMAYFHERWWKAYSNFNIKMEVKAF